MRDSRNLWLSPQYSTRTVVVITRQYFSCPLPHPFFSSPKCNFFLGRPDTVHGREEAHLQLDGRHGRQQADDRGRNGGLLPEAAEDRRSHGRLSRQGLTYLGTTLTLVLEVHNCHFLV